MYAPPVREGRFRRRSRAGRHRLWAKRALPSRRFAALRGDGRGSRKRRSVDAVLGRPVATVGPGSSASRVRRARGRVPRHPGGGLARPGEKPGSVRTHLRRRSPRGSPQGPAGAEVAGPGTKSVARGVRRNPPDGGADLPILPFARSRRPAREKTRPALPSLRSRDAPPAAPPGPPRPRERRRAPPLLSPIAFRRI